MTACSDNAPTGVAAGPVPATHASDSRNDGSPAAIPRHVHALAAGIFAMVTSEFMAGGLLPEVAAGAGVSLGTAALLVSAMALGQAVGGPVLLLRGISRLQPRTLLTGTLLAFAGLQAVGFAVAGWHLLLVLRVLCGVAMAAYFGLALTVAAGSVPPQQQARASAAVFAGLTFGTTLGLPIATAAGHLLGWRTAFLVDSGVVALAAVLVARTAPRRAGAPGAGAALAPLASRRLWVVLSTGFFTIGAAVCAFSFYSAVLRGPVGVSAGLVPWLLGLYGGCTIVGNTVVGRIAHRGPARVLAGGLAVMVLALLGLAAGTGSLVVAVVALVLTGLTGMSLNPALAGRAMATGGASLVVSAMTASAVCLGILAGSWLGGRAVDWGGGLDAPLLVAAGMACLGLLTLLTLLPDLRRRP